MELEGYISDGNGGLKQFIRGRIPPCNDAGVCYNLDEGRKSMSSIIVASNKEICTVASDSRNIKNNIINDTYKKIFTFPDKKLIIGVAGQSTFMIDGCLREICDFLPEMVNKTNTSDWEDFLLNITDELRVKLSIDTAINFVCGYIKNGEIYSTGVSCTFRDEMPSNTSKTKELHASYAGVRHIDLSTISMELIEKDPIAFAKNVVKFDMTVEEMASKQFGTTPCVGGDIKCVSLDKEGNIRTNL